MYDFGFLYKGLVWEFAWILFLYIGSKIDDHCLDVGLTIDEMNALSQLMIFRVTAMQSAGFYDGEPSLELYCEISRKFVAVLEEEGL